MPGIGPRLKRERIRLKLSQSTLGAIGGVETNAQSNYENGIRSPRADYLARISDAGIDVTYVVTGFSLERPLPTLETHDTTERLNRVISRLHKNLHDVTQNIYHMARLLENHENTSIRSQVSNIKEEAEAITVAAVRLIYVSSKLN
ncbi:transcriptional regulator [Pseudomonas cichorii]|uniref:helix-turn-helix domain-containing protein n=1 Tax=Pseudomonas cichorii TaxID=36746 RepID=UPI001910A3CA|nr:helix-turn-helix transcriptional regulator [Pseudomonas cichorii]GFM80040.1 transcriptional regulator [Pseudomonas cichorii]